MPNFTKMAIKSSFLKLLNERPLNKITVRDIVEDCGINRNSFYYHYQDITALIEEIVTDEADQIIQKYPSIQTLDECVELVFRFALQNKKAVYHILRAVADADLRLCDRGVLRRGVRGSADAESRPRRVPAVFQVRNLRPDLRLADERDENRSHCRRASAGGTVPRVCRGTDSPPVVTRAERPLHRPYDSNKWNRTVGFFAFWANPPQCPKTKHGRAGVANSGIGRILPVFKCGFACYTMDRTKERGRLECALLLRCEPQRLDIW